MRFHSQTVYTLTPSPLGPITLAASPAGLCGIWFEDQQHRPDMALWRTEPDHPVLKKVHTLLSGFFAHSDVKKLSQLHLPFDPLHLADNSRRTSSLLDIQPVGFLTGAPR